MSVVPPGVLGAGLGLLAGIGLLLVVYGSPLWRPRRLAERIDPYLRRDRQSALLAPKQRGGRRWEMIQHLLGPVVGRVIGILERITGGPEQLERRLQLAGRTTSADTFRLEQVVLGLLGMVLGGVLAVLAVTLRGASPLLGLLIIALGALGGVLMRDYLLGFAVRRRAARMAREFPTVADLLALAVAAGESPVAAMERVATSSTGALPEEFAATVAEIRAGATVSEALAGLGTRTPLDSLGRFGEGVAVAIERGTPLAEVLRAQAQDARETSKRDLLEAAGRREIFMLVPVVFFVLPLVIVFAIFPGLAVLEISL
ncbi:type II secretion system F family protein [Brachybacterium hainanense]|uniref:Type II secretion system F family protein n=1 Tax=Brachybacterium hainanense TaxID=1541174 RepID=A0ABV6RDF1_9MICO